MGFLETDEKDAIRTLRYRLGIGGRSALRKASGYFYVMTIGQQ